MRKIFGIYFFRKIQASTRPLNLKNTGLSQAFCNLINFLFVVECGDDVTVGSYYCSNGPSQQVKLAYLSFPRDLALRKK